MRTHLRLAAYVNARTISQTLEIAMVDLVSEAVYKHCRDIVVERSRPQHECGICQQRFGRVELARHRQQLGHYEEE